MSFELHPYDVRRELDMQGSPDFHRKARLQPIERLYRAVITNIVRLTDTEKLFCVRLQDREEEAGFTFHPGQFVMLALPGFGEVPISISSSPSAGGRLELCIRQAGMVTGLLHQAREGALVGIRGPFGTHFPMDRMKGSDVLLIAGGLGLAPLRSPIAYVTENLGEYGKVNILYGARRPQDLLFDYQYEMWRRIYDVGLSVIVDEPGPGWTGPVGRITDLLEDIEIDPSRTFAVVCGPPVMFKFVCERLREVGVPMQHMFVSLERRMHCGMGKCCRCNIGATFTCLDGPVFDYWSAINQKEAI